MSHDNVNDNVNDKVNGDLISRRALLEDIRSAMQDTMYFRGGARAQHKEKIRWAFDKVRKAPAVDAAPVVHGRWIWVRDEEDSSVEHLRCSVCMGNGADENDGYCRHCGAKLDLEE